MRHNTVYNDVIKTASRLFYKQGYNATGINQIIDEGKISKAGMYTNFRTKEDILEAYLEQTGIETNNALRDVASKPKSPRDKALGLFDFLNLLMKQPDYYGCNFLNIVSEVPVENERIRTVIKAQKDGIRDLFKEILTPAKKEQVADELYLLFEAALIGQKVHGDTWPVDKAKAMAAKLI
jgi:AcrR family transcriptional regulator